MKVKNQWALVESFDREQVLKKLERIGRVCYGSEDKITDTSAPRFIERLVSRGHESVLEHVSLTVEILTDRGIQQELTRHRLASYTIESTRYIKYKELVVCPSSETDHVDYSMYEDLYRELLQVTTAEHARDVLPLCLAGKIYMTANLRQWRHIFKVRYFGQTGRPHPKMLELMHQIYVQMACKLPEVFKTFD